jgi:two-component system cell cycle sensor histidine kinase/response regulator CckA
VARLPRVDVKSLLGSRSWAASIFLGLLCLGAGAWGFLAEVPENQNLLFAIAYFFLPACILVLILASRDGRTWALLAALGLLDVEAALLGAGPVIALPFVVAVPLICVAVAARVVRPNHRVVPYAAAWLASSAGVTIALLKMIDELKPSSIVVVPAFMFVDALALALLWYSDDRPSKALKAVVEAETRVRDLLEEVELVGIHIDRGGRIDFINDFALKLTGWTRDEALGKDWHETFATPDRRDEARQRYRRNAAGDPEAAFEKHRESTILTKSGEVRLIRWSHVNRRNPDGSFAGMASLGEDITASRAAEDAARRNAEMLSRLVVSSPLPTAVLGLDMEVQLWNPAVVELVGWTEEEVLGKPFPPALYQKSRWVIGRTFARARRGWSMDHEIIELTHRDGRTVLARIYGGLLFDSAGEPMSVGLQAVDVTQSLAIEAQLREAQKMEAVGRLAGGVAHDFNNSLTAIGGFAALIASGSKEPETREAAETILGSAKRAADLTRELLAYSRKSMLMPQVIEVNEMIGAIRPMLRRLLGEDVSVVIESHLPVAMVRVDPGGLERVILNLAANARDAMPGGGRLTISTERRLRDASAGPASAAWVAIRVTDTGTGIPVKLHSQVFDPFFTTKQVGAGTGLGLATVKGFVVQSGGEVGLSSKPGHGTTIEILLPEVADTRNPPAEGIPPPVLARGNETILVVEDEPAVAAISFQVLSRGGYRVLLADSGESAVGLLRGHAGAIALLLVDVVLPDMRGPQLLETARSVHPESAVLFASGYSAEAIDARGEAPGDVDLIEKPYAPDELLRRVRLAIDRSAAPGDDRERIQRPWSLRD